MNVLRLCGVVLMALLAGCASTRTGHGRIFNVLDFGAAGDGRAPDTPAIQRAIDAAAASGQAATVLVPRGRRFLVGSIELRGGIEFKIDGELVISTNREDYKSDGVINALDACNLTISGHGGIAGRSLAFMSRYDAAGEWWIFKPWRPKMFVLTGCTNLVVRDITFGDAPFWGLHLLGCRRALIENVTVHNRLDVPNCDGIDPDHCQEVDIRHCHVTCGDDAIVIKSTRQTNDFGPCANIRVHDCVLRTADAGLKIGTETTGGIHDVLFERCRILSAGRGLAIQLRDEGSVSNIVFRDIRLSASYHAAPWWGKGESISFTALPRDARTRLGTLRNVLVQNVTGRAENSARVEGTPGNPIANVRLENVSLTLGKRTKYMGGFYDNRPSAVAPPVERHDTPGFDFRWAEVTMAHCAVYWKAPIPVYFTDGIETGDGVRLRLSGFEAATAHRQ